ncbi:chaperone modulator CbpM [Haliea sp.]|uniref:chaperone modulator CbpM n=1 Tax=Haliea sp. TaxID=1932666 RepID=UPI0035287578
MSDSLFSISFNELCQLEGIDSDVVIEIVEYGIVRPANLSRETSESDQWLFDTTSIRWLKKALRLHRDLEIDWLAVAMVVDLMRENEILQKENDTYQRQLARFIKDAAHPE